MRVEIRVCPLQGQKIRVCPLEEDGTEKEKRKMENRQMEDGDLKNKSEK